MSKIELFKLKKKSINYILLAFEIYIFICVSFISIAHKARSAWQSSQKNWSEAKIFLGILPSGQLYSLLKGGVRLSAKRTLQSRKDCGATFTICVRAGLSKPHPVPDTERIKDTKTLDNTSTPLDANTLLCVVCRHTSVFVKTDLIVKQSKHTKL
jgi:hypothetical protein